MQFYSRLLPSGCWGIYEGNNLLATIGCPQTCQEILQALQRRQRSQIQLGDGFAASIDHVDEVKNFYSEDLEQIYYHLNLRQSAHS